MPGGFRPETVRRWPLDSFGSISGTTQENLKQNHQKTADFVLSNFCTKTRLFAKCYLDVNHDLAKRCESRSSRCGSVIPMNLPNASLDKRVTLKAPELPAHPISGRDGVEQTT